MERLHFSTDVRYSALEAAIHLGRYAVVRTICPGKRVLDVACGEGYGSYQLAAWGASRVDGVDISEEAIESAKQRFASPAINYHQAGVDALASLFGEQKFDVIVSLETIEHLSDPHQFLVVVRDLLAPGGTIVISCPNDHWYYKPDRSNPFHVRKYTFEEYRELAEGVLGPATSWRIGTLAAGFVTMPIGRDDLAAGQDDDQSLMLRNREIEAALLVPAPHDLKPTTEDCSFFVGVWGPDVGGSASVTYPLSMEASDRSLFGGEKVSDLRTYIGELQGQCGDLETELKKVRKAHSDLEGCMGTLQSEVQSARELANRDAALRHELEQERRERVAAAGELERSLRLVSLRFHAAASENEVLRTRAGEHLSHAEHQAALVAERDAILRGIPWRVVGVYRRLRPLVPAAMLRGLAAVIDRSRGAR